jgi:hypothetical protein
MMPAAPSFFAPARTLSKASGPEPDTWATDTVTPSALPAASSSRRISGLGLTGLVMTVNRDAEVTTSRSSSTYFWLSPGTTGQPGDVTTGPR